MIEVIGVLCSLSSPESCQEHVVTTSDLAGRHGIVMPYGCATACQLDEAASRRAPGSMALRDRQAQRQGSVG